jgi:CheY-like chemotaxis protein
VQAGAGRAAKEGTGLGLAITRQLVELMKGEIHVTSDVGRGTDVRFEIELPQSDDETAGARRAPVKRLAPDSPQPRIAVVDDSAENRLSLASLLRLVGFEVREAANGREAVELWASWKPDLIFMDQRMPEMDGSTATRAIRTRERITEHRTKIVALTASVFEHERDSVLASGADDFVLKPFDENTIFDVLAKHLGVTYIREGERRATGRILVVDDSSLNRQFVGAALANLGFAVTEATNGIEALELLGREDGSFDAVLLDIEMPELDGRETVKRIRADARLCELPVIALTAHDADEISRIEGMTDFVTKPVDEQALESVLARHGVRLT